MVLPGSLYDAVCCLMLSEPPLPRIGSGGGPSRGSSVSYSPGPGVNCALGVGKRGALPRNPFCSRLFLYLVKNIKKQERHGNTGRMAG